jgi:oxygen-independent coproporphyrinogen-3 oxidase
MNYNSIFVSKYLGSLSAEIKDKYEGEEISTLYIGGGTPSCLSTSELEALCKIISTFKLKEDYEFTFECNIGDINSDLLMLLKNMGVNRLSIGVESFDSDNLELMNRYCTFEDAYSKIELCREMGFDNINIDLIYALPNEEFKTVKKDIELALKLKPDHISTYSLILEDNTLLKLKGYQSIDEELDYKMYNYIIRKLTEKGYVHYEISNFAKPGKESRHNLNCWDNNEYYGFGLGAAGYFEGVRYQNTRNLTKYLNGEYVLENELVTKESKMKYELMLGLRKLKGINIKEFHDKYNENIQNVFDLNALMKNKDLILKDNYLFINPKKIYLMNEILLKIL